MLYKNDCHLVKIHKPVCSVVIIGIFANFICSALFTAYLNGHMTTTTSLQKSQIRKIFVVFLPFWVILGPNLGIYDISFQFRIQNRKAQSPKIDYSWLNSDQWSHDHLLFNTFNLNHYSSLSNKRTCSLIYSLQKFHPIRSY